MEILFIKCLERQGWNIGREGFLAQDCGLWACPFQVATDQPGPEAPGRPGFSHLWKSLWPRRGDYDSEWGCWGLEVGQGPVHSSLSRLDSCVRTGNCTAFCLRATWMPVWMGRGAKRWRKRVPWGLRQPTLAPEPWLSQNSDWEANYGPCTPDFNLSWAYFHSYLSWSLWVIILWALGGWAAPVSWWTAALGAR